MEKKTLEQLYELKQQLLEKAIQTRNKLRSQEEKGSQALDNFNITLSFNDDDNDDGLKLSKSLSSKSEVKICEILRRITGIEFKEVDKKWLHDDVYLYTATVQTKMVSFNLELSVHLKDSNDFKIENITCFFINTDEYCIQELFPWFKKLTATKNFSFLMSALSDYNEYCSIRTKIANSLEKEKYAKIEKNIEQDGGILVHIFPPADTRKIYITIYWTIKFMELTWHIEHFFKVNSTDAGTKFSQNNSDLLMKFCDIGLTKNNLIKLWDNLCNAVDSYHANYAKDIDEDS